jgi:DNA polymerase III gamma/tau subunit
MASSSDFRTKYRPRRYEQLWQGVDHPTIARLRREEELQRYPRGMVFCGDYGCGKTTAARIRGMRTSCWRYLEHPCEPCGDCPGCRAARICSDGPDYFELDATQEKLRAALDRALRKTSIAKAHSHPHIPRVFFIDEAHRAPARTQETLLKDIEDHQEAIFILSTTQPDRLDPAIRKRCTLYLFETPTVEQAAARLEEVARAEQLELAVGVAHRIAQRTQAVPRDCLGALYDLSFGGPAITLAAVERYFNVDAAHGGLNAGARPGGPAAR